MATAPAVPQRARETHEPSEEPPKLLNTTGHTLRKGHTMLNKEQAIRYSKQVGVRYHIYNNYGCLMGGTKTREQAVGMKRRF